MKIPKITSLTVGKLAANCYIITVDKKAIIIDPGAESQRISKYLASQSIDYDMIINTHGHVDHISANGLLKKEGVKLCIHKKDAPLLVDPAKNLSSLFGCEDEWINGPAADCLLLDEEIIHWEGQTLKIIHTPGHTQGSISILMGNCLFSGDTLFASGIGRTDLPGGSQEDLISSIRDKLFTLAEDTIVYPGHGYQTTIGHELKNNPFLLGC